MTILSISLRDVQNAAARICQPGYINETPLLEAPVLAKAAGFARLFVKNETTHPIGAFKLRGAFNHFRQLTEQQKSGGVFAISSGNHAQAVAYAARQFRVAATILMPADAPRLKLENTRNYGAEVITYDRVNQDREDIGRKIAEERGLHLIHPYNDPITIAGQGTVGIEIHQQMQERGVAPDAIIAPCSGGGLAAGIAVTRDLYPAPPAIFTAEPQDFDDTRRSLDAGKIIANSTQGRSACDALMVPSPGSNVLPVLLHHKVRGLASSDEDAFASMLLAAEYIDQPCGTRLEPSGTMALACALRHREQFSGKNVVIVASGANVDPEAYAAMLERGRKTLPQLLSGFNL